jgi:hypothetical protein
VTGTLAVFAPSITSTGSFTFAGNTITRNDLLDWAQFGFAAGQTATVDGHAVGTIAGISGPSGAILTITPVGTMPSAGGTVSVFNSSQNQPGLGGNVITVTGGGGPGPGLEPTRATGTFTESCVSGCTGSGPATSTLTRTDGGSWLTSTALAGAFVDGMVLSINGTAGWTITGVTASTLTLSGAALTSPSITGAAVLGFAPSPLAIYGSTSQDGIWYSGNPFEMIQRDFGSKPFPNVIGNASPDFIFPVANSFRYAGNNVIDASADFANVPEDQVPSVGLILYAGPGNDTVPTHNTIYGSQAPDFIAGGSGNTTIYGERGDNQLLGNDGLNVDVITRAISFPVANTSIYPNADPLLCPQSPTPHCNTLIYASATTTT